MKKLITLLLINLLIISYSYSAEKRLVLLIGNSSYNHVGVLSNPVNDISAMSKKLSRLGFDVMVYQDLSQIDFKKAIDEFGTRLKDYDIGMFYYAGHGLQINGVNYLVPIDARIESELDVEYTCIDAGRLLSKMEASDTKTNIIILDACRNNPFTKSWNRSITKEGLAFMEAPVGSIIAYSTAPGETASDGTSKNSLYTEALLKNIDNPKLNSLQVFQKVRKTVRANSSGNQIPWESTSLENDFYFNQSYDETAFSQERNKSESDEEVLDRKAIISRINEIKVSDEYLWAEAFGETVSEADDIARTDISLEIVKKVYENKDHLKSEFNLKELSVKHQLFCQEIQNLVARRVYKTRKGYSVFRFIPVEDINKQVSYKTSRVEAIYQSGKEALDKLDLQDGLKYFFWSYALISNHPGGDLRGLVITESEGPITLTDIKNRINSIIDNVTCTITDSIFFNGSYRYNVEFYLENVLLKSIGFKYWNGVGWSELNTINSGTGFIDVYPGYSSKDIKVNYEYKYPESAKYDNYLYSIINTSNDSPFRSRNIASPVLSEERISKEIELVNKDFLPLVRGFLASVDNKSAKEYSQLFSEEGLDIFRNLILYGNASTFYTDTLFHTFFSGDNTYIRGIPLKFNFTNSKTEFVENITLEISPEGLINNISFSLGQQATDDIINQQRWPDQSKWEIIRFLENYKTAYALKRIDYIDKIFSDRALIIVGKRIEESVRTDDNLYSLKGEKFQMTRLSKDQYMYRLKKVFNSNEFINIKFEENIVRKRDNETNVYGINIKQNYYSSSYADQGHLFLMVDLKDNKKPIIYVRSWQPEKFRDGRVVSLSDFTY